MIFGMRAHLIIYITLLYNLIFLIYSGVIDVPVMGAGLWIVSQDAFQYNSFYLVPLVPIIFIGLWFRNLFAFYLAWFLQIIFILPLFVVIGNKLGGKAILAWQQHDTVTLLGLIAIAVNIVGFYLLLRNMDEYGAESFVEYDETEDFQYDPEYVEKDDETDVH